MKLVYIEVRITLNQMINIFKKNKEETIHILKKIKNIIKQKTLKTTFPMLQ